MIRYCVFLDNILNVLFYTLAHTVIAYGNSSFPYQFSATRVNFKYHSSVFYPWSEMHHVATLRAYNNTQFVLVNRTYCKKRPAQQFLIQTSPERFFYE